LNGKTVCSIASLSFKLPSLGGVPRQLCRHRGRFIWRIFQKETPIISGGPAAESVPIDIPVNCKKTTTKTKQTKKQTHTHTHTKKRHQSPKKNKTNKRLFVLFCFVFVCFVCIRATISADGLCGGVRSPGFGLALACANLLC